MIERVGVLGGAFDPPHCGHVLLGCWALSAAPIDRLLIVPAFAHVFGKSMAPFAARVELCSAAFGVLSGASVSRIEEELEAPSYTVRTIEALAARMPRASFRLILGADALADLPKWKDPDRLRALAPPFTIGRGGIARGDGIETPDLPAISSTEIRARIAAGQSIAGLVPRAVEEQIRAQRLYRA